MEDRSLDDFLPDDDAGGDDVERDAETDTEAGDENAVETDTRSHGDTDDGDQSGDPPVAPQCVEPATVTASWRDDGQCEACDGMARRRWEHDGRLVCGDCTDW